MKNKIIYAVLIICSLAFVSYKSDMTNIEKLTLKIEELLDQGNVKKGLESVNVTTIKIVSVASAKYEDLNGGFRIKNISDSVQTFRIIMRDQTDTVLWKFHQGYNPEVIKTIVVSASNSTTTIYTGK